MLFQYPLAMDFKILSLIPEVVIKDGSSEKRFYLQEELSKFKDVAYVYSDETKAQKLYSVNADSVIELTANYKIYDCSSNQCLGSVKQEGIQSLLKATFSFMDESGKKKYYLKEGNPWIKFIDAGIGQLPVINMFTGYIFNPEYVVYNLKNQPIFKIKKLPSFFENHFKIMLLDTDLSKEDELYLVLGLMMVVLVERVNG